MSVVTRMPSRIVLVGVQRLPVDADALAVRVSGSPQVAPLRQDDVSGSPSVRISALRKRECVRP